LTQGPRGEKLLAALAAFETAREGELRRKLRETR